MTAIMLCIHSSVRKVIEQIDFYCAVNMEMVKSCFNIHFQGFDGLHTW